MTRFTRHSDSHLFGNSPSESAMNSGAKSVIETLCSKQNVDDHFNHRKKGKKMGALNPNPMVYYQFSKHTISSYWEPISQPNSCMLFLSPLFRQTHISSEKVVWWVKWKMAPSARVLMCCQGGIRKIPMARLGRTLNSSGCKATRRKHFELFISLKSGHPYIQWLHENGHEWEASFLFRDTQNIFLIVHLFFGIYWMYIYMCIYIQITMRYTYFSSTCIYIYMHICTYENTYVTRLYVCKKYIIYIYI